MRRLGPVAGILFVERFRGYLAPVWEFCFSPVAGILFVESLKTIPGKDLKIRVSVPLPGFYLLKAASAPKNVKVWRVSVPLPGLYC